MVTVLTKRGLMGGENLVYSTGTHIDRDGWESGGKGAVRVVNANLRFKHGYVLEIMYVRCSRTVRGTKNVRKIMNSERRRVESVPTCTARRR